MKHFFEKMSRKFHKQDFSENLENINFLVENAYFKDFEDNANAKTIITYLEQIDVFWNFDFEGILDRFCEGFGRPKSSIFAFFSMFFRCKILIATWKGKNSKKNANKRIR